ncbi:MAG: hypothetical protein ACREVC_16020, partial [Burkholderiales bacterium]
MKTKSAMGRMSRRQFGKLAGATAASGMLPGYALRAFAVETADQIIPGKSAQMIIHNAKLGVMETPLTLLRQYAHTPKEILFCRFHYPHEGQAGWYASLNPPKREDWILEIDGLVGRPREVKLADIEKMDQVKR